MLSRIYLRSGQYEQLFENLDEWARSFPDREEVREEKEDIELFRGLPDQVNGRRRASVLAHDKGDDFSVPLLVDGKPARYLLDTGAWISAMTEGEAARLGLVIRAGEGTLGDASGKQVKARTAVAKEITIGSMRLRNVSFIVFASEEPFGLLGMPVLLAAGSARWSSDGTLELGESGGTSDKSGDSSNLVFYENHLLLATSVSGARVFGTLDTGAVATDLNANFAGQFSEVVHASGTKGTQEITGLGGTVLLEAVTLPEVAFEIGTTPVTLRPAHVTLQRNPAMGGECCIGNVGLDLLMQTDGFVIDFSTMTLRLD